MLKKLSLMMIFVVIFSGAMFFGYNQGSEPEPIDKKVEAIKTLEVIGYELVQKSICAGVSAIVGVSAPTSLAIELAADFNLTLLAFARKGVAKQYAPFVNLSESKE